MEGDSNLSCEDTTLCLFMEGWPDNVDPANQCWKDAVWHIWYEDANNMTQACEAHLGRALGWAKVKEFHEFGSACNVPYSWWFPEAGTCVTEETGLEIGFLVREGGT